MQITRKHKFLVHDLDLFVTVQLLDETPAVLSLHILSSKHGCSSEWKIGETPQLTKNGKSITCRMDNFVPRVAPGVSSYSSSSSSSTSRSTNQSNYSRNLGTLSDPVTTRSDKHACGKPMLTNPDKQATQKDEMDKEDPTQGIPAWLQPFTVNLKDLETHVLAHSSERENSDSEGDATKVETQKRMHRIHTHFPKNRKRPIPRAEKFDELITAEHKILSDGSESRSNHWYAVVQVLATQWIQSYPCKTKTSQETDKNSPKFLEPSQKPKVMYTNCESGCAYHGIPDFVTNTLMKVQHVAVS